ncbi:MAG: aryl-sulfate sulfotransferase [Haloferacaceae archaeon]
MDRRRIVRAALGGVVVVAAAFLLFSFVSAAMGSGATASVAAAQYEKPLAEREPIVPPSSGVTVVTGQGFGGGNAMIAFGPQGRVLYHENRHDGYFDVDPSPRGDMTVTVVTSDAISAAACNATLKCQRDVVTRINMTTGERERLHTVVAPQRSSEKTHDADVIGRHRLLVGGLPYDRVYVVNTTTGIVEWQWSVDTALPRSSGNGGAGWPKDWTHLNDVERLPDGRYMVSLRNQDRVVFVDPKTGMQPGWTLGGEDEYSILYEQHNPDYIPASRGGPAVLVADSHNNRIVEYQRANGSWKRTWTWTDERMKWPRDADRLPNGNTLIVDTSGDRVLEVNQSGGIVWQFEADSLYDAERLGTGDESAGGRAASALDLPSRTAGERVDEASGPLGTVKDALRKVIPQKTRNAVAFVLPGWIWWSELFAIAFALGAGAVWAVLEVYWRDLRPQVRWPVYFE